MPLLEQQTRVSTPPNRQTRRQHAAQSRKEQLSRQRDAAMLEAETVDRLGFTPPAADVADLIDHAHGAALFLPDDTERMLDASRKLRTGAVPAAVAYAAFGVAIRRGPAADKAVASLAERYQGDDVIELRAVSPDGGAASFNGRVGHEREQMTAFVREHLGRRNIYHGINPRVPHLAGSDRAAKADDVLTRRHVVLDLDAKDAPVADPDWSRTVERLASSASLVTTSGNGTHVWFPIETVEGAKVAATTGELAGAMSAVGADNMADPPRIIRLPFTINLPTRAKRQRGAKLALALVQQQSGSAPRRAITDLVREVRQAAHDLSLPGKLPGARGASRTASGTAGAKTPMPAEMLRAPSRDLLATALALMPNPAGTQREDMVRVFHAVKGAAVGTDFEDDARSAALDWAGRWTDGGDPDHDARTYDGIRDARFAGWPHVRDILRELNPAGIAQIEAMERPLRAEAARVAFAGATVEDSQIAALASKPESSEPQNSGGENAPKGASRKGGAAAAALDWLLRSGTKFFNSPDDKLWVEVLGRVLRIDEKSGSPELRGMLARQGHIMVGNANSDLKDMLVGRALGGETHAVHHRQADSGEGAQRWAVLNMMDEDGNGILVEPGRWRVVPLSTHRVKMTRRAQSLPLPRPVTAGDGVGFIERLRRHVPLAAVTRADDPADAGVQQEAAVLVALLAQLFRPGAVPHLLLSAEQGSGKTTTARRLKGLVDPDVADVVTSLPDNDADLYAIAAQQPILVVDNLSRIKGADQLAALSTGVGVSKRALYTDGARAVFRAKASVIMTTIREDITSQEDLRDRMLRLDLPRIDPKNRRTEAQLDAAWRTDLPSLIADMLDLLAGALARLDTVRAEVDAGLLPPLPRLADAALVAEAAAQEAGWKPGTLIAALNNMRSTDAARQLEDNPCAVRVRGFLGSIPAGTWTGGVGALHAALSFVDGPDLGAAGRSVQAFTAVLDRVTPLLRSEWGIEVVRQQRTKAGRTITLRQLRPE